MKSYLYGLILNIQFFTIFPLSKEVKVTDRTIKHAVETFPVIGFVQGAIFSGSFFICLEIIQFSPLASSFILWMLLIVVSGALHLDGWMDCSDAYFSYQNKEKRLDIMKDSRVGALGVISVIILLTARFIFIYEIALNAQLTTYVLIVIIPYLGKLFMGMILYDVPLAKKEGMGQFFKKAILDEKPWIYLVYLVLFGLILYLIVPTVFLSFIILIILSGLLFIIMRRKIVTWFGGITGDVIGASVEGVETFLWMTVWLLHYFVMV